jgi:hypothetical protein
MLMQCTYAHHLNPSSFIHHGTNNTINIILSLCTVTHAKKYIAGVTIASPQGTGWKAIDSTLIQLEAGPDGEVWGVNSKNELYRRSGVSTTVPMGTSWMKVGGQPLKFVTVGKDQLYSIDLSNVVFSGTLRRVGAGQKLPGMANIRFWYDRVYYSHHRHYYYRHHHRNCHCHQYDLHHYIIINIINNIIIMIIILIFTIVKIIIL